MNYPEKKKNILLRCQTEIQIEILQELKLHNIEIERLIRNILEHQEYSNSVQSQIEQQKSYNAVVLAIGYAGFFAVWAFLKDIIPDRASSLTAIMVGFSLLVYVVWEVYIVSISSFETVSNNSETGEHRIKYRILYAIFPYVWLLTIIPALSGCFLLFYNAIAHFSGIPMWPN